MRNIDNTQDVMDSRDVIECLNDLEADRESLVEAIDEAKETDEPDLDEIDAASDALEKWDLDNPEYQQLRNFVDELENYGDWEHGETLIRESYFTEYAEEFANDIGAIDRDANWPLTHIDWEAAANELKIDYTTGTLDGVEYLMRA